MESNIHSETRIETVWKRCRCCFAAVFFISRIWVFRIYLCSFGLPIYTIHRHTLATPLRGDNTARMLAHCLNGATIAVRYV